MLSKNMYKVLSCIPKDGSTIEYSPLLEKCKLDKKEFDFCLNETVFPNWNYIRTSKGFNNSSELSLTESGVSGIEQYEDSLTNKRMLVASLAISIVAMIAAVASAVTAIVVIV